MASVVEILQRAWQLHQARQWQAAEQLYRQALAMRPEHPQALFCLGLLARDVGQTDVALKYLTRAVQADPSQAPFHAELGQTLQAAGKLDEAVDAYAQALRLQPDLAAAHNNLGNVYRQQGRADKALGCYERAIACNPQLADAHNNRGTVLQDKGQVTQAIACYQRAIELRPDHFHAHFNLGIAMQRQGDLSAAAAAYERALRSDPEAAVVHFHLGVLAESQGRRADAEASYRSAVELGPGLAGAHNNLAVLCQETGRPDEARAHYRRALAITPNFADAHFNLGTLEQDELVWLAAEREYQAALALEPGHLKALVGLGQALEHQGRWEESLACFDAVLAKDPQHATAHYDRAVVWLTQGRFDVGWPEYEWRWKCPGFATREFAQPVWDGSNLAGRTILVHAEQGLGDTFQFSRYLALVANAGAGEILFQVAPALVTLLGRAGLPARVIAVGDAIPRFDVHAPLLSLPGIFGTRLEDVPAEVPYLDADPVRVRAWHERLSAIRGFKVGISWQGRPDYRFDRARSIPLAEFAPLASVQGVRLISLQKRVGTDQLAQVAGQFEVIELGADFDEAVGPFVDTAAVMKGLDLVITSDTAVAHLAGALALPVWVALARVAEWRWLLDRDDSPWYPTMRVFRQADAGDWSQPFSRMARQLAELVAGRCG